MSRQRRRKSVLKPQTLREQALIAARKLQADRQAHRSAEYQAAIEAAREKEKERIARIRALVEEKK